MVAGILRPEDTCRGARYLPSTALPIGRQLPHLPSNDIPPRQAAGRPADEHDPDLVFTQMAQPQTETNQPDGDQNLHDHAEQLEESQAIANRGTHSSRPHCQAPIARCMNCQVRVRLMLRTKLLRCRRTDARKHCDEAVTGLGWEGTYLSRLW
jgi:hypothetical protein